MLSDMLIAEHRHCDEIQAALEGVVTSGDWSAADSKFTEFNDSMLKHFRQEEEVLFPEFENATGMTQGPTQVMRMEHVNMREAIESLGAAVRSRDVEAASGELETLHILIQQHNMKEEQILYPMTDQHLASRSAEIEKRMKEM